jgi:UDP-glucose 4-epimerase
MPFVALSRCGAALADGTATTAVDFSTQEVNFALLQGVDVVFHLAGIAHNQAQSGSYSQVNHLATLALAKASADAGVKCFVYLSSVKAMGAPADDSVRTEEQCTAPTSAYGMSKLAAEQDLQSEFSNSEMAIVILRPTLVYGPAVKGNLLSMRRAVRAGIPRPPELGGRSMIAVQDLAAAMLQIASEPPPGIHLWIVCDGHRYSARRIYDLMRAVSGNGAGISWLPLWVWRFGAYLADGMRDRGADSKFSKLFGTELYSSAAIMQALSWQPQFELVDIVPEIMAAREEGSR